MNGQKILSLDLALTTGWALIANGVTTSGSCDFHNGTRKHDNKHKWGPFLRFHDWIKNKCRADKVDLIIYEEVRRWSSSAAAHSYCGLRAIMWMAAGTCEIDAIDYSPSAIKKSFTGKGNANKAAMIKEAKRRWPDETFADDNEVDARALLDMHLKEGA